MNIEVGNIVEGKVIKIKPFGAIVLINDNIQGLVHVSNISTEYVQDINKYLKIGDIVNVKILSIDNENNKVSLSIKDALPSSKKTERKFNSKKQNNNHAKEALDPNLLFEEKFKEWLKDSNERLAGINKRNNRR